MFNRLTITATLAFATTLAIAGPVNVTTWRYDMGRTGQNLTETALTPSNVNTSTFGKLYSYAVDGYVYSEPLYLTGINVGGQVRNVVFIATQHDSVYAFDADHNTALWKASLLDAAHGAAAGATTVPSTDVDSSDIVPEIGITGTPVIDATNGVLYVVSKTKENGTYVHRLHALNIETGNENSGSPVAIQASVPGNGIGSSNGTVSFLPQWELQRTSLLLIDGVVYVGFGAHGDNGPYHGWLLSYNASTLKQIAAFNSSPNGKGNGIWQSGEGIAADVVNGTPRIFIVTGNFFSTGAGASTPTLPYTAGQNYCNSIVRFDATNGSLAISDDWTPFDSDNLSAADLDQTSGGALLLPDQPGPYVHELVQVGKNGRVEVLDRDDLGGFSSSQNNVVQELSGQVSGLWSTPAYWNSTVYFWGSGDYLKQFSLSSGRLSAKPVATASAHAGFPGSSPVVTSNGTSNGIVWAIRSDGYTSNTPAILYAYNAANVGTLLYASSQNATRDSAGTAVKMTVPLVVNGKVYVGAQGEVDVYGLLNSAPPDAPAPTLSPAPGTYATARSVSLADTLSSAAIYYTTNGTVPSASSTRYTGPITVNTSETIQAIAIASGYNNSSVESGTYTIGTAPTINFSNGFSSAAGLTLNGSAVNSDDSRLQLTTGGESQAGSFFWNEPVNIQTFATDFSFQLSGSPPIADGITFTVQNDGPTALGPSGGGLGYGPGYVGQTPGITHSMAVKFDVYSNEGEGTDSTGLYTGGVSPTIPATDLTSSGIVLSSGDVMNAHAVYDGTYLYLTLADAVIGKTFAIRYPVNLTTAVGANSAYVGFTGGTGIDTSSQKILTWTFSSQPTLSTLKYATASLAAVSSGPTFSTLDWAGFPDSVGTILYSTKAGDNVTYTVNVAAAGTYDLHVTTKNLNIHGIWQLSIDGVKVGSPVDEYTANPTLGNYDMGPIVISTAGKHQFKFTVTGRNPQAQNFEIAFDDFILYTR
jgi:chitobiase/beta-hexosaminidase-like protein